jgi:cupin 2 domain-containing protein
MAEADLQRFLRKVQQLNAFVALSEANPQLRQELAACSHHNAVVALARRHGFEIGRRWGESDPAGGEPDGSSPGASRGSEMAPPNLPTPPCPAPGQEITTLLAQGPGWRLERIHSCEASSPEGFWYEQAEQEWVTLVQGSALLQFEDEPMARSLSRGDVLLIEPHRRHRVLATDPAPGSVWLALFWKEACAS